MRRSVALLVVLCAASSACALLVGLDPLEVYTPENDASLPDVANERAVDGIDASVDASLDALPPGEGGSVGEAGTAPCDRRELPPASAVYVSAAFSGAASTGAALAPYRTIEEAIGPAKSSGAIVVDEGTYKENIVFENLPKSIKLDGAWKRGALAWTRDCSADRALKTLVQSTTEIGLTVRNNGASFVTLSNLTIETRGPGVTAPDAFGASRYGVFVESSIVKLDGVIVRALAADNGGAASEGAEGKATCVSSTSCSDSPPAKAADAPPGASAATFGAFTADGFEPAAGATGDDGPAGAAGEKGAPGPSGSCWASCQAQPSCDIANAPITILGQRGQCGCGGGGGQPGKPGRGGGGSIALYAVGAARVDVQYSELIANNGGNGSEGGAGGPGAEGTVGVAGPATDCWENKCCRCGECPSCGCYGGPTWDTCCASARPANNPVAGGPPGGTGAPGGKGANGGAGAGGPSYARVTVQGANVTVTNSKLVWGSGGSGGAGAAAGPAGARWPE